MANLLGDGHVGGWVSHKFVTGEMRVRPGGQIETYGPLDVVALSIKPAFIRRKGVEVRPFESCSGCGARKSEVVNGKLICAYCKGETNGKL